MVVEFISNAMRMDNVNALTIKLAIDFNHLYGSVVCKVDYRQMPESQ